MSDLNDKELFEAAIADEPVTQEAPEAQTEETGQPRDEQGRFAAAKAEETAQEQPQQTEQPSAREEAHVPSWRLREVNEAREAAERRAQEHESNLRNLQSQFEALQRQIKQNEKPQDPVDFFADPNAALKQSLTPFEQRMQAMQTNLTLRASKAEAIASYGKDAVAEMETALDKAMNAGHPGIPGLRAQMLQSDDPVGVAMQWHQREKLLQETGGDLSAYKNKTLEDALKDPAFLAKALEAARAQAGQATKPNVQLPPSINRVTSAASPHEEAGDLSSNSLYAFATR